jgi:hypothetical protein
MDTAIVTTYCLVDDWLRARRHSESPLRRLSDAEILTTALVAGIWRTASSEPIFLIDSFPVAVCDNIRIKRCRLYPSAACIPQPPVSLKRHRRRVSWLPKQQAEVLLRPEGAPGGQCRRTTCRDIDDAGVVQRRTATRRSFARLTSICLQVRWSRSSVYGDKAYGRCPIA